MKYNKDTEDNSTSGNRGKFTDRLKKILRDKLKKKKDNFANDNILVNFGRNILKIFLSLPSLVYSVVKDNKKNSKNVYNINNEVINNINQSNDNKIKNNSVNNSLNTRDIYEKKRIKVNKIRDIDVNLLKKKKDIYLKDLEQNGVVLNNENFDKVQRIQKLQKEIIDLIKKKLIKSINELEVLQSELYVLKELDSEDVFFTTCQEDIKQIKKLLSKVKSLKEKYDYLKDNVDFEYMLEYEDNLLIDKILQLKELCTMDDIRYTIDNYKILDEYKFLYLKIDKLQEDTNKLEEYKRNKLEELRQRDIDFEKLKADVYDIDRDKERYDRFVLEQNLFLKDLEGKISNIDSHENVTYRLKGFNKMLGNSFKYLGLLLVNPLKGLIPGIATQTLVTKNVIKNLYNNLEWEENRKMVYDAIDYSLSINMAINNLDYTSSMIDSTLVDIAELKRKYMKQFSQYESNVYGYREAIKKLNKIENAVLGSRIKIDLMKVRMMEKERQNTDKFKIVKKLNSSKNN